jgi:hypothetical protein
VGATIKYLRRTTSGAADNGLGTTIKHLRRTTSGAADNGLGATIKYLRRTTSGLGTTAKYLRGAAGIGLCITIKYLRRTTRKLHRHQVLATHTKYSGLLMRPFTTSAPHLHDFMLALIANKQNSTAGARRLRAKCVCGPVLARSVHS